MRYLTTEAVRSLDRIAQDRFAIPGILLMEHASLNLAHLVLSKTSPSQRGILILCGKGNNGGDGFAAARHLHNGDSSVDVILLGRLSDLPAGSGVAVNARIASKMGITIHECPRILDALKHMIRKEYAHYLDAVFGTGLETPLRGDYPALFNAVNALEKSWTAVDVPSGLNSDTGEVMGAVIQAKWTVTFAFAKRGFQRGEGPSVCGEITVADIGLPREMEADPEAFLSV